MNLGQIQKHFFSLSALRSESCSAKFDQLVWFGYIRLGRVRLDWVKQFWPLWAKKWVGNWRARQALKACLFLHWPLDYNFGRFSRKQTELTGNIFRSTAEQTPALVSMTVAVNCQSRALPRVVSPKEEHTEQGDQIGQIFAQRVIVFFR
jgi:hypothetical protein